MTRHIIDRPSERGDSTRAAHFLRVESESKVRTATRQLQQRPHETGARRLREFLRIARGIRA